MDSPAFPFTVFTDRRGEVVALFVGELHRPQAEFILSQVQNLNQAIACNCPRPGAPSPRLGSHSQAIVPDKHFRRRSPPKLAFSPQFLVIIADLCKRQLAPE